jgi:hypothetical protein
MEKQARTLESNNNNSQEIHETIPMMENLPDLQILFAPVSIKVLLFAQDPVKCGHLDRYIVVSIRDVDSAWLHLTNPEEPAEVSYVLDIMTDVRKMKEDVDDTGKIISLRYTYHRFEEFVDFEVIQIESNGLQNLQAFDFLLSQFTIRENNMPSEATIDSQYRAPNIVARGFETSGSVIRKVLQSSGTYTGHAIRYLGRTYTHVAASNNRKGKPSTASTPSSASRLENSNPELSKEGDDENDTEDSVEDGISSASRRKPLRKPSIQDDIDEDIDDYANNELMTKASKARRRKEWASGFHSGARTTTSVILYPVRYVGMQAARLAQEKTNSQTTSITSTKASGGVVSRTFYDTICGMGNGVVSICKGVTEAITEISSAISDTAMYHATEIHGEEYANQVTKHYVEASEELGWASYKLLNVLAFGWQGLMIDAMVEGTMLSVALYDFLIGPVLLQGYMNVLQIPLTTPVYYYVVLRPWSISFYKTANDFVKKPHKIIATAMLDTHPKVRLGDSYAPEMILGNQNSSNSDHHGHPATTTATMTKGGREEVELHTFHSVELNAEDVIEEGDEDEEDEEETHSVDEKADVTPDGAKKKEAAEEEEMEELEIMESEGVGYIVREINKKNTKKGHHKNNKKNSSQTKNTASTSSSTPSSYKPGKPVVALPVSESDLSPQDNDFEKDKSTITKTREKIQSVLYGWNGGNLSRIELCTVDCSTYLLYPPESMFMNWFNEIQSSCLRVETIAKRKSGAEELAMRRRLMKLPKKYYLSIKIKRYIQYNSEGRKKSWLSILSPSKGEQEEENKTLENENNEGKNETMEVPNISKPQTNTTSERSDKKISVTTDDEGFTCFYEMDSDEGEAFNPNHHMQESYFNVNKEDVVEGERLAAEEGKKKRGGPNIVHSRLPDTEKDKEQYSSLQTVTETTMKKNGNKDGQNNSEETFENYGKYSQEEEEGENNKKQTKDSEMELLSNDVFDLTNELAMLSPNVHHAKKKLTDLNNEIAGRRSSFFNDAFAPSIEIKMIPITYNGKKHAFFSFYFYSFQFFVF